MNKRYLIKENLVIIFILILLTSPVWMLIAFLICLSSGLDNSLEKTFKEKCVEDSGIYIEHKSTLNLKSESCEYRKD